MITLLLMPESSNPGAQMIGANTGLNGPSKDVIYPQFMLYGGLVITISEV